MDSTASWWITLLGGAGVIAGLSLLVRGLSEYRATVRVGDTSTSTISSVAAGEVRISGVVEAAEMTLVSSCRAPRASTTNRPSETAARSPPPTPVSPRSARWASGCVMRRQHSGLPARRAGRRAGPVQGRDERDGR